MSLLAIFLFSPNNAPDLGARFNDFRDALYQNLLVAAIVFGALALLVLLAFLAHLQGEKWKKEEIAEKERRSREEKEQADQDAEQRHKALLGAVTIEGSAEDYLSEEVINLRSAGNASLEMCGIIGRFVPFYTERAADRKAREIVAELARQAATRPQKQSRGDGQMCGVCLFGERGMGKSRLVYEALTHLEKVLADWTLVRWRPRRDYPYDLAKGKKIVLLLDGLQDVSADTSKKLWLNKLSKEFESRRIPFIIVATCRDGEDRARVEENFRLLLAGLEKIELEQIFPDQADEITAAVIASGFEPQVWDEKTPGSIIARFSKRDYEELSGTGRMMMKMLWLFHSAGIGAASGGVPVTKARVRALADPLFDVPRFRWRAATDELIKKKLVIHTSLDRSYDRAIYVADDSFFTVIDDYPVNTDISNNMEIEDWSTLYQALRQLQDGEGLLSLGAALRDSELHFRNEKAPSKRDYLQRAADCYRAALEGQYEREKTVNPERWAEAQWNLAGALDGQYSYMRADDVDPSPTEILQQAEAAYRAAQQSLPLEDYRDAWVGLTTGLAGVLQRQAELVDGDARDALLADAERQARDAIANVSSLDEQASVDAKTSLAYVNLAQAKAAASREAVEALVGEANELATSAREDTDYWLSDDQQANAEANLQYVVRFQASLVIGSKRAELLDEIAGSLRKTLAGYQATSSDRVEQKNWMQAVLAEALLQRARMVERDAALGNRYLDEAAKLCREAEEAMEKVGMPDRSAWILGVHAGALAQQVRWAGESDRDDLLRLLQEGEGHWFKAQGVPNRLSAPEDWANTQLSNAEVQFQFARLELAGTEDERAIARRDLNMARDFVEAALEVYRLPAFKGEYEYAMTLRNEIDKQVAVLPADVEA